MTRLTELRLGSRKFVNYNRARPLTLIDKVQGKYSGGIPERRGGACMGLMNDLFLCWKEHDFDSVICAKEQQLYEECITKARNYRPVEAKGRVTNKTANKLLREYSTKPSKKSKS